MDSQSQPALTGPYFRRLLCICEYYLGNGDYSTCRHFAVKAQICNPNHPCSSQILAICSILIAASSSNQPDWYSILHLPQFTKDLNAISQNYNFLFNLVNPAQNPYPSAAEAHKWVGKAWSILSKPRQRALVDKNLKAEGNSDRKGVTSWTRCPYCSCTYEYDKMYEKCSLKCQNIKCRCPFVAFPFPESATPPSELVNNGVYLCCEFSPLAADKESNNGTKSWKWLDPLASIVSPASNR